MVRPHRYGAAMLVGILASALLVALALALLA